MTKSNSLVITNKIKGIFHTEAARIHTKYPRHTTGYTAKPSLNEKYIGG